MKRRGFTLIDVVVSLFVMAVIFTGLAKMIIFANQTKHNLSAEQYLTAALVNFTEQIVGKVRVGNEVTGYVPPMGDIKGEIQIAKDYISGGIPVYIVNYSLRYKGAKLSETVVILANE